jgi:transcriptional regulator with XRE-family HTH domain
MTPGQCRAARALLGITQAELADAAEAGTKTVADFERGAKRELHVITLRALHNALEEAGIEFLDTEGRPGVRLKKPDAGKDQTITPEICRAAREFLYINQQQLADASKVRKRTIADFERGMDRNFNEAILRAMRISLEKAGIEFIDANGGGLGVRLKKK